MRIIKINSHFMNNNNYAIQIVCWKIVKKKLYIKEFVADKKIEYFLSLTNKIQKYKLQLQLNWSVKMSNIKKNHILLLILSTMNMLLNSKKALI